MSKGRWNAVKNTIISIGLIAVIALCACSRAAADRDNLVIVNRQETAEVYSIAVRTDDATDVGQNADGEPLTLDEKLSFDMGTAEDCTFDVAIADNAGRIISLDSFTMSFMEGVKQTLYVVAGADGALMITDTP